MAYVEEGLASPEDDEEIEVSLDDEEEEKEEESEEDQETDEKEDEVEDSEEEEKPQSGYGKRAQKRIRQLIKQRSQFQSKADELEQKLTELNRKLEQQTSSSGHTQDFAFSQFEERVNAQEAALEAEWEAAYEDGDKKKLFSVQNKMSKVALDRARLDEWKRRKEQPVDDDEQEEAPRRQQEAPQQEVTPRLQKWLKKNSWFKRDEDMTLDALQIDQDLKDDGVEVGSVEYFNEVDKRMRELYPEKLKAPSKPKQSSAGARGSGVVKKKTKVTLSASEKATADRLGISYENYAREKAKLEAEQ